VRKNASRHGNALTEMGSLSPGLPFLGNAMAVGSVSYHPQKRKKDNEQSYQCW
jgi:hypothetical protein